MKNLFNKLSKRKIILVIGSVVIIIGTSYAYSKNVKATEIKENFNKEIRNNNYEDALKIYNNSKDDVLVMNTLNTKESLKNSLNNELIKIKDEYISEKISFKQATDDLNKLKNLDIIEEKYYNDLLSKINKINDFRQLYMEANELFKKNAYEKALTKLSNIEKEDKLYCEKALTLKEEINDKNEKYKIELQKSRDTLSKITQSLGIEEITKAVQNYVPAPEKESFVNSNNITSENNFLVCVNLKEQKTNIFIGKDGDWKLIKEFESSTGAEGKDTPSGCFKVRDRGDWFFSPKYNQGGKYWVQFKGNYLFHSVPMDINKRVVDDTLGSPVSHGCIRLSVENSKWIYDNIPNGTTVYIR